MPSNEFCRNSLPFSSSYIQKTLCHRLKYIDTNILYIKLRLRKLDIKKN